MEETVIHYENGIITTNSIHKIARELAEYLNEFKSDANLNSKYDKESYYAGMDEMLYTLIRRLNNKPIFKAERLLVPDYYVESI